MTDFEPSDDELAELENGFRSTDAFAALDDLWTEVQLQQPPKREKNHSQKLLIEAEAASRGIYTNPENWKRTRGVALIHAETRTLLGNFSEYTHTRVKDCRKLLREEEHITIEIVEEVSGSWWLGGNRKPEPVQVWHERRPTILHLYLPELRVHSPGASIVAFLSYGAIARVELATLTRFAQFDGDDALIIELPAETNIYEVLSLECKIKLKKELSL